MMPPIEMHARARAAGLTIRVLCERAGIAQSTFVRWKRGAHNINVEIYGRLKDVLDQAEAIQSRRRLAEHIETRIAG